MTRKVFTKLLGLFILLLVFHTVVMEIVFRQLMKQAAGETLPRLGREALWSGVIALAVALPLAAWVAMRIAGLPDPTASVRALVRLCGSVT